MSINNSMNNNKPSDFYHASKLAGFPIPETEHVQPKKQNKDNKQLLPKINTNQQIDKKTTYKNLQKCLKIKKFITIDSEQVKLVKIKINSLIDELKDGLNGFLYKDKEIMIYLNKKNTISLLYQKMDMDEENLFYNARGILPEDWWKEHNKMQNLLQFALNNYYDKVRELGQQIKLLRTYNSDTYFYTPILEAYIAKYKIIQSQITIKRENLKKQYQEAEEGFKKFGQKVNKGQSSMKSSIAGNHNNKQSYLNQNNHYNLNCYQIKNNNALNNQNHKLFGEWGNNNKLNNVKLPIINGNNYGNNLNQHYQMNKEINHNANQGNNNNIQNKFNNNYLYPINNIGFLPEAHNKKLTSTNDPLKNPEAALQYYFNNKPNFQMINFVPNFKFNNKDPIKQKQNENKFHIQKLNIISTNNNPFNNNINNNNNQNKYNNDKIIQAECKQEQNNGNNINDNIKLPNININSKQNDSVKENKIKEVKNYNQVPPISKNIASNNKKIKLKPLKQITEQQTIYKDQNKMLANLNKVQKVIDTQQKQLELEQKEARKELDQLNYKQDKNNKFLTKQANKLEKEVEQEFNKTKKEVEQNNKDPINKDNVNGQDNREQEFLDFLNA